jgi:hyperosmotically inducible periplasmic protein
MQSDARRLELVWGYSGRRVNGIRFGLPSSKGSCVWLRLCLAVYNEPKVMKVIRIGLRNSSGVDQKEEKMFASRASVTTFCALLLAVVTLGAQQNEPKAGQNLIKEVRHQLVLLPYYSVFDDLSYRVEGSKVILMGQLVRPSLKSDAEAAAKSVEGVSSVENDIEVLPPAPMDDQIRRATFRAIYSEPALSRYAASAVASIHIIVKGGHVKLEGVVDNETDKNMAGIRANGVPDVLSVTNNLVADASKN